MKQKTIIFWTTLTSRVWPLFYPSIFFWLARTQLHQNQHAVCDAVLPLGKTKPKNTPPHYMKYSSMFSKMIVFTKWLSWQLMIFELLDQPTINMIYEKATILLEKCACLATFLKRFPKNCVWHIYIWELKYKLFFMKLQLSLYLV